MKVLSHLRVITIEEGVALRVNAGVGSFLFQQRTLKRRSIRTVARKLRIKRASLERWEAGVSSPPASVFYSLVRFYGEVAYQSAVELDFQFQQEKYVRMLFRVQSAPQFRRIPAVIWAEDSRFQIAA